MKEDVDFLSKEFLNQFTALDVCFCVGHYREYTNIMAMVGRKNIEGLWRYSMNYPSLEKYEMIIILPGWKGELDEFYTMYPDFIEV